MNLLTAIKSQAAQTGFDACGVARCRPIPEVARQIGEWTGQGFHAGMDYLTRHSELRQNPARLFEGAKSVIVCLMSYKNDTTTDPDIPQIASYARGVDYHYIIKDKLNRLLERLQALVPGTTGRACVDSTPVAEKFWAVEAGLGWTGRNSLLIHPTLGSQCFIGILLTSLELDAYDAPYTENHCGSCRRCIEACPAGAIREEGLIDARRCLSYQTIENRGEIPAELLPCLGNRLFGCDTCQDVCPRNRKAPRSNHPEFRPDPTLAPLTAENWLGMGSGEFKRRFGRSPLARAGLKKLKLTLNQKSKPTTLISPELAEF